MSQTSAFFLKFALSLAAFLTLVAGMAVYADSSTIQYQVSDQETEQIAEEMNSQLKDDIKEVRRGTPAKNLNPEQVEADNAYEKALADQVRKDKIIQRQKERAERKALGNQKPAKVAKKLPRKKIEPDVVLRPLVSQHPEYLPEEPRTVAPVTTYQRVVIDSPQKRKKYYNVGIRKKPSVAVSTSVLPE